VEARADSPRIAVIGMGNLLMTDDGVGVHALHRLQEGCSNETVRWVDGGTDAWGALHAAQGCRALLILDAVRGRHPPGTVYRLSLDELRARTQALSLHEVSLVHAIGLQDALGEGFDAVRIVGMEPERIEWGIGLSEACSRAMPQMLEAARSEIGELKEVETTEGAQRC